ncbi:MAG: recombinase family protein [Geminicoccaceae bacterium]
MTPPMLCPMPSAPRRPRRPKARRPQSRWRWIVAKAAVRGVGRRNGGSSIAGVGSTIRCAVYTRKSSEEGLEQEFNSLDAQREACEAYVLSQRHEGWSVLPEMYDDGGVSGGTMERPALQRLLADIRAKKVDTVVVYKVDRLTRSLSDFAKIVDVFDANGVSFVSVTQSFNTTTSMGRLTLNMLLSFAQFEREVTGERIRDKIAASKKKGMWMGGVTPLGYDVQDRKLVVNEAEAETVRLIFRRYAQLGSVRLLQRELVANGIVSKRRVDRFGNERGGVPLVRGAIYLLLQNRIYRGEIVHAEASYPGEHKAIVDEALWDAAQKLLAENRVERRTGATASEPSLLAGFIYDDAGERMVPTHANKKGTRYRYYVSQNLIKHGRASGSDSGWRIPAADVESLVEQRVIGFLGDGNAVFGATESAATDLPQRNAVIAAAAALAGRWLDEPGSIRRGLLQQLVRRITVHRKVIEVAVVPSAIPAVVTNDSLALDAGDTAAASDDEPTITLAVPARLQRTGMEMRLLVEGAGGGPRGQPERSLLRLLARAHHFNTMLLDGQGRTMIDLASEAGVTPSYFTRVLRLSFLAPDIVKAIMHGRQPAHLTARLMASIELSPSWVDQVSQFGIA